MQAILLKNVREISISHCIAISLKMPIPNEYTIIVLSPNLEMEKKTKN